MKARKQSRAVALQYNGVQDLPSVVAAGIGEVARRIVELAKEHNIPVHEDSVLAEMLATLEEGEPISPETFRLVAELLCFLYAVDRDWREQHPSLSSVAGAALAPDLLPEHSAE